MQEERESYDQSITIFSPDGRMFQVEYAREAVSKGSMSMGMIYKNGILMMVEKRVPYTLVVPTSIEKMFKIEENIICATSGLIADARVLVDYAREEMADYRLRYDEKMPVVELVKRLSNIKRIYTQYGGVRPFGVSLLVGGIDDSGMNLFETDPSGAYKQYFAGSIGEGKDKIFEIFEEKYSDDLDFTEAVGVAFSAISTALNKKIKDINLEMVTITKKNNVKHLSDKDIKELKKAVKF
jgi:proteasome alpha subunit